MSKKIRENYAIAIQTMTELSQAIERLVKAAEIVDGVNFDDIESIDLDNMTEKEGVELLQALMNLTNAVKVMNDNDGIGKYFNKTAERLNQNLDKLLILGKMEKYDV